MKGLSIAAFIILALRINLCAETFADSSITFTYPSSWKIINNNDTNVTFDAGNGFVFMIDHAYGYDGNEIQLAEDKKAAVENKGGHAYTENSDLGGVFAIKMTENTTFTDSSKRYISYLYRDNKFAGKDAAIVSSICYGGKASDFAAMEPQCMEVYKSIKFKTRKVEMKGEYYFECPVCCAVKTFDNNSQYILTNVPLIRNKGALVKGFYIRETTGREKPDIDKGLDLNIHRLKYEGCRNIAVSDTIIGGKAGKAIKYKTLDGAQRLTMYVGVNNTIYIFSFDADRETEIDSFYKTADLIMSTFKFEN